MMTSQKSITEVCWILICSLEIRAANCSVLQAKKLAFADDRREYIRMLDKFTLK